MKIIIEGKLVKIYEFNGFNFFSSPIEFEWDGEGDFRSLVQEAFDKEVEKFTVKEGTLKRYLEITPDPFECVY